jgi:hypothetical protein
MWVGIILQLSMLGCLAVLVWYAGETLRVFNRIDLSFDKLRAFLDAQDISRRADETEELLPFREKTKIWLFKTSSFLDRLCSAVESTNALVGDLVDQERSTIAVPPPASLTPPPAARVEAPPTPEGPPSGITSAQEMADIARQMDAVQADGRSSDCEGTLVYSRSADASLVSVPPSNPETTPKRGVNPVSRHRVSTSPDLGVNSRRSGYHSSFSLAAVPVQASAPAQVAAGLGPRPTSRAVHSPPVRLTESTRSTTLIGTMPVSAIPEMRLDSEPPDNDPGSRPSWEQLKRGGMTGTALRPVAEPRFPGTQVSMQAIVPPGSPSPSSGRRAALVEVKEACRDCTGGFVHVGTSGIEKCQVCSGSGLVATLGR